MTWKTLVILICLVALWFCPPVNAGQVALRNGDRLTGTLRAADAKKLTLHSELLGEIEIPWTAVETLTTAQPVYVSLSDGRVLAGTVAGGASSLEIATQTSGRVSVSLDQIQALRSAAAQAAYQAEQQRLEHPGLFDFWSASANAGLSMTRGNARTLTLNLGLRAARTTRKNRIGAYLTSVFAQDKTTGVTVTTANAIRGGLRYDALLNDRLFAFGLTDFESDEFQDLDLRNVLAGGIGYRVLRRPRLTLSFDLGASFNQEFFSSGEDRRSGEALLGQELIYRPSSRLQLQQRLFFYPNLSRTGEYRFAFDSTASTKLNGWLSWEISLSDRFLSNPLPGIQKNDLLLTSGVRVTLGKEREFAGSGRIVQLEEKIRKK